MSSIQTKCIEITSKDGNNNILSSMCVCVSGISRIHNLCDTLLGLNIDTGHDITKEQMKEAVLEKLPEIIEKIVK